MMEKESYLQTVASLGQIATDYLKDMERTMERFHRRQMSRPRYRIARKYRSLLKAKSQEANSLTAPKELEDFQQKFAQAYTHLSQSCEIFCYPRVPRDALIRTRLTRRQLNLAQLYFYPLRKDIPAFNAFWLTEDKVPYVEELETHNQPDPGVPLGLLFRDWDPQPPRYSLFVPENYDPQKKWPLLVALHGGGGNDADFIWVWVRHAKSRGYILIAPKSVDATWTFSDLQWVLASIEEVSAMYNINQKGIFLAGISDGGTFTYEFGLSRPDLFAALAAISGGLVPFPWHDYANMKHIPVYVLHGTLDQVIEVEYARNAKRILEHHGFPLIYRELPDWGHSTPFEERTKVFDFFDDLLSQAA